MTGGGNFDKTWLQSSLNSTAVARALEAIETIGQGLPCQVVSVSGSIVTVSFEVAQTPWVLPTVTIPKAEGPWIRSPTQPGDFGVAMPAGASIGAISGQGGGTASLALQGNLSNLIFIPVASVDFTAAPDQNKALVQGPAGGILQTSDGKVVLTVSESGMTLVISGVPIMSIGPSGINVTGFVDATGDIAAFSNTGSKVGMSTHRHTQANDSHGDIEAEISVPIPGL
jgi:hypothetical protein